MPEDRPTARARSLAYRRLAARPRSRTELASYLEKKGLPREAVDAVLEEFTEHGYIDDGRFAHDYGRYLIEYRSLGRYALRMELRKKGVSEEEVLPAVDELFSEDGYDEYEVALRAAEKKAATLEGLTDRSKARRRLTDYLRRRGYGFEIIRRVLKEVF